MMLSGLKNAIRRRVRGAQRAGEFPLLLPHHRTLDESEIKRGIGVSPAMAKALELCDGTRTLAEVARVAGVSRAQLIEMHDRGGIVLWYEAVPPEAPRIEAPIAIVLSPHPDDAALSCAAVLLNPMMTGGVLVLNVFDRTSWWRFARSEADQPRLNATRAKEENVVSRLTGAEIRGLGLREALLRGHTLGTVFTAAPGIDDDHVASEVGRAVGELARQWPKASWYLPLGVGGHIDHRIARDAALAALHDVKGVEFRMYEDLPYAAKGEKAGFFDTRPDLKLVRRQDDFYGSDVESKLELLRAYWSQFTWSQIAELGRYARAAGGGKAVEVYYSVGASS